MSKAARVYTKNKVQYFQTLNNLLDEYNTVFIVHADNVGSNQMQQIRISLRGMAVVLMGKNTMMRKCIREKISEKPDLEKLLPLIKGNIGFVFTNKDLGEVKELLLSNRVPAAAKAGAIAPVAVTIPAGPTPLDPGQTSFFQALTIPTKINKGAIEILSDVSIIVVGQKVGGSEAALLAKLGIKPFSYGLEINAVFTEGNVMSAAVLDLTDDDIANMFLEGVQNIACISLGVGYPTLASLPHVIINGYKNVLAVSVATDYTFDKAEAVKAYLADPSAFAAAASTTEESKEEEKKAESSSESDSDMGMDMFG